MKSAHSVTKDSVAFNLQPRKTGQATSLNNVFCAGEATGLGGSDCALIEGQIAGHAAGGRLVQAKSWFQVRAAWHRFRARLVEAFALRPELKSLA